MRTEHIVHLCCPSCRSGLTIVDGNSEGAITEGALECERCGSIYPIVRSVPRFVPEENYAASFGLEWTEHARTQYDATSGRALSKQRFFEETRWPYNLQGQILIEPGSGSGRFTEIAASTGATLLSLDMSVAADVNFATNGHNENVLIVQGDITQMPFPYEYANRLFCFGVLQHTPDPRQAFLSLPRHLRPGGRLVADVYQKKFTNYVLGTKYWVRPLTRRVPPERLYRLVRRYVDLMWPTARVVRTIPRIGPTLNWRLLVADYSRELGKEGAIDDAVLKDWAYLDTFDMLSPQFDQPQTLGAVRRWCNEAGLNDVEVVVGYNGIEIHATTSQLGRS
ncbi:Trm112p-like protein [Bradyrhizobium sacchari]|uniref:Trm112p-like protein n=1 Tax=Bradyrhizobium sacchari TaxID=1399419 RepID=A0A560KUZ9_9BRAD|nr:Trm112p-like protein [Bradyrhizobium sacchari]TWB84610.1 Trm112p-like protein [Bradyrhizobium sacchari]